MSALVAGHLACLMLFGTIPSDSAIDIISMSFNFVYVIEMTFRVSLYMQHRRKLLNEENQSYTKLKLR